MLHRATITDIMMDSNTNEPLIILLSETKSIKVAILLGVLEAISILSGLAEIDFNLPTPHDLVKKLLEHESIRVIRTEIFGTDEENFYAKIYFLKGEDTFSLNARPSDAISLSLTFSAPIYIDDSILINQPVKGHEDITNRRKEGKDWAEYLQSLSRDEFGKYII